MRRHNEHYEHDKHCDMLFEIAEYELQMLTYSEIKAMLRASVLAQIEARNWTTEKVIQEYEALTGSIF
jgi:hypothetical protein